jgi:hypothetical protein
VNSYESLQGFRPRRAAGTIFLLGAIALLALVAGWGLWQASQAQIGLAFLLYLLPALVAIVIAPMLVYRLLALRGAYYRLGRDGISLRWGLRFEDIPIDAVSWIRLADEVGKPLPLPWLRLPGAVLGIRRPPGDAPIEYLAAGARDLVLVATAKGVYAISPENPAAFLAAYQRLMELGSLAPMPARSLYPTFLLGRVWRTPAARYVLLAGLALNLLLAAWVFLVAPGKAEIIIGFQRGGEPVPGVQLLLLPVLSGFFFLVDFFVGLFFYRRGVVWESGSAEAWMPPAPYTTLAYLLWGSAVLTPFLFLVAFGFILIYPHL